MHTHTHTHTHAITHIHTCAVVRHTFKLFNESSDASIIRHVIYKFYWNWNQPKEASLKSAGESGRGGGAVNRPKQYLLKKKRYFAPFLSLKLAF